MPFKPQGILEVVDGAYAAALDDDLWLEWAAGTADLLGGVGATFWVMKTKNQAVERFLLTGRPVDLVDEYFERWGQFDPQVSFVAGLNHSRVYTSTDHIDLTNEDIAAYVAWQRRLGKVDHHLAAAVVLDDDHYFGGVSVHRALDDGAPPERHRRLLQGILPDIQRAMQLGFRHNRMLDEAYWAGITAVHDDPAILIDEAGCVCRATQSAIALFTQNNDFTIKNGRLHCADPSTHGKLQALIVHVTKRASERSCAMRIKLRSGKSYGLVAYPLARKRRDLAPFEAAALIRVIHSASHGDLNLGLLREAFHLTAREAELATLLMKQHPIDIAAAVMSISGSTARVHLRNIFAKTGTNRQSDMLLLLSKLR